MDGKQIQTIAHLAHQACVAELSTIQSSTNSMFMEQAPETWLEFAYNSEECI